MPPRKTARTTEALPRKAPIRKQPARAASVPKPTPKPTPATARKPAKLAPAAEPLPTAKPWKPPRTQKTDLERSISQIGAPVPPKLRYNPSTSTKLVQRVLSGGSNGPPVLDRLGYKLSHPHVSKSRCPAPSRMPATAMLKVAEEGRRVAEMMGVRRAAVCTSTLLYFHDQVARDLDVPFHTVGIPEYEEWYRRGFRADPSTWEEEMGAKEAHRIDALAIGCAFRE